MRALALVLSVLLGACDPPSAEPDAARAIDAAVSLDPRFEACGRCHVREAREHAGTLHARAFDDPLFQREWSGRTAYCVGCHAPLASDARDPRVHDGVGCASCHVRDGTIVSRRSVEAPHAIRADQSFGGVEDCAGCHEFDLPRRHGPPREQLQHTLSEWRASGRDEVCIDCHMTEGSHVLRGPCDEGMLARALDIEVTAERRGPGAIVRATLEARAGHAVPTGDLNRTLVLRAWSRVGPPETAELARLFGRDEDGEMVEIADQRVLPNEARHLALLLPRVRGPVRWSLTWHAIAPDARDAESIELAFRTREIATGTVSLDARR